MKPSTHTGACSLALLSLLACSATPSQSTLDASGPPAMQVPTGTTPCAALASCCHAGGITGTDAQSCDGPFDAGSSGESFCQGNFDSLRRDGFCSGFSYTGFVPYTVGVTPGTVTTEPSACAAVTACCVSNEVWGDASVPCKMFADGTTNQSACSATFDSLRAEGYCGGFTFSGAAALGNGSGS